MYIFINFCLIFVWFVCFLLLTWQSQKKQAGILILDVGRLSTSKITFWFGVILLALAGYNTWLIINEILTGFTFSTYQLYSISQVIFFWFFAIYSILLGLSRLELRENGIYYKFSLIKWQELASYEWNRNEPNILIIGLKKPRLFLLGNITTLQIPFQNRNAVNGIMVEYLI